MTRGLRTAARDALRRLPDGDNIDRIEGRIWPHLP